MIEQRNNISIVMPCFNEQAAIPVLIPRTLSILENMAKAGHIGDYELVVVDDQSTDASADMLALYENVKVVRTTGELRGYGSALKCGFLHAKNPWICFLDVDNSYRPEDLPLFISEIQSGKSDFIMGTRGFRQKGMTLTRGTGNWVYMSLAKMFYGSNLDDVCSGYRLFHRKYLSDILDIQENGLDFSIYLTLKMVTMKVAIKQIPIQYDERLGESKLSVISDGFSFLKVILTLKIRQIRALKHSRV